MIETNENYWDCKCNEDYIHAKNVGDFCPECGAHEELQPDSRQGEIDKYYDPRYDNAIFMQFDEDGLVVGHHRKIAMKREDIEKEFDWMKEESQWVRKKRRNKS